MRKVFFFVSLIFSMQKNTSHGQNMSFSKDFLFSVASSAYQIEGAWNEDGKGENFWDRIVHTRPDFIENKENADVACDSYHRYKDDIGIIKSIGEYLLEVQKAVEVYGCAVIGYTVWSLVDNFEWRNGYETRFSLVHVDFNNPGRNRTLKSSAYFFKQLLSSRTIPSSDKLDYKTT